LKPSPPPSEKARYIYTATHLRAPIKKYQRRKPKRYKKSPSAQEKKEKKHQKHNFRGMNTPYFKTGKKSSHITHL
jgi:hypothetical protein